MKVGDTTVEDLDYGPFCSVALFCFCFRYDKDSARACELPSMGVRCSEATVLKLLLRRCPGLQTQRLH